MVNFGQFKIYLKDQSFWGNYQSNNDLYYKDDSKMRRE